jgi:hypothetical protein
MPLPHNLRFFYPSVLSLKNIFQYIISASLILLTYKTLTAYYFKCLIIYLKLTYNPCVLKFIQISPETTTVMGPRSCESSEIPAVQPPPKEDTEALRIADECSRRAEDVLLSSTAAQIVEMLMDPLTVKIDTSGLNEFLARKARRNAIKVIFRTLKEGSNIDDFQNVIPQEIVQTIGHFLLQIQGETERENVYTRLLREVGIRLRAEMDEKLSVPPLPPEK